MKGILFFVLFNLFNEKINYLLLNKILNLFL